MGIKYSLHPAENRNELEVQKIKGMFLVGLWFVALRLIFSEMLRLVLLPMVTDGWESIHVRSKCHSRWAQE